MAHAVIREGKINFFAASDITCYVLRGSGGDLLIDTGMPQTWKPMRQWLQNYNIRWVFLTHAHADHDWNAAKMQQNGAKILLSVLDKDLRRNFLRQRVMPTSKHYALRNVMQCVSGGIFKSPPYEADIYFGNEDSGLLRTLGFDAEIIPLPGHTYGSCGILSRGVLYCGDAFTMIFGRPEIPPHAVAAYRSADGGMSWEKLSVIDFPEGTIPDNSLRVIESLHPDWLACGHGLPVRYDRAAQAIADALTIKYEYN